MHLTKHDIEQAERKFRLNLINSISGAKPANLIGTISDDGQPNLAIFSSVFHLGSNPALLGFITRPTDEVPRHTYENIKATGFYTINAVPSFMVERAHYTSAKFERQVSEFERCGIESEYLHEFKAPFVKNSPVQLGMRWEQEIPIPLNGTILMVGSVEHLIIPDELVADTGYLNLEDAQIAAISGLNSYYSLQKIGEYPYARPENTPNFNA
jgi:flavin reductase (DIM6/NTAB) family NADH-FMN oxidoreductase RutF